MSEAVFSAAAAKPADTQARTFLAGLLLVSVLPAAFFALVGGPLAGNAAIERFADLGTVLGTAHVALTGWFWTDRDYRSHIHTRQRYFYAFPTAVVVVSVTAVYLTGPDGFVVYLALYTLWAYHHFGRQGLGVLSLSAVGTKSGPTSNAERQLCRAAPVAGVLGAIVQIPALAGHEWAEPVRLAGFAAMLGVAAVALAMAARQARRGAPPLRAAMLAMVGLFFLPVYLLPAPYGAAAVGVAHSFQYALIVGYMAASRHRASPQQWRLPLGALVLVYLALYLVLRIEGNDQSTPLLAAATTAWMGIATAHFIADAGLWRLAQPFQRTALRERLPFLFRG